MSTSVSLLFALAALVGGDLSYNIPVTVQWANGQGAKQELLVRPELKLGLGKWEVELATWLRGDRKVRKEGRNGVSLEHLTLTRQWERLALVVGKQQVVWGQLDGVQVLDVVNPRRYDQFILDEEERSRRSQWMLNAEYLGRRAELQLLWVPRGRRHRFPGPDEAFRFTSPRLVGSPPPPGWELIIEEEPRGRNLVRDSDVGLRLSTRAGTWDLTANYLYREDDGAATGIRADPVSSTSVVRLQYDRHHLFGATASTAIGDWVTRLEVTWINDRLLSGQAEARQADELSYGTGLDYSGFRDTFVSLQLVERYLLGPEQAAILREKRETTVTLKWVRDWRHETLVLDFLAIQNTGDGDGLIRPKLEWEVNDYLRAFAGYDLFHGKPEGLYGQFKNHDRVFLGLEYIF